MTSAHALSSSPSLRVTILHNYRDLQQPSMRLYAERLGAALTREGVHVARVRPPGVVPPPWLDRSPAWTKIDAYAGRFIVYPRLVRTLETDVVHVVDHGQGYLLANLDARRTVVTCHDVVLLALAAGRIGSARVPPIALQLFRISLELMKRAAAVVADSLSTKQDLVGFVGLNPADVQVIHPGLNQDFEPNPDRGTALREALGLGRGPLVLHVGRTFYKNIPGVLRVLHRVREEGLDVRLVRVGRPLTGEDAALAERLALVPHILELGAVPDAQIPALYNAVDLLLFPSLYEGFGWPPLEAMASGTPVVSSRAGSLDEVVGDAALTADPEDIETLAWHVASILTEPRVKEALTRRGLAHAARFNWARTAQEMRQVYSRVLAKAA